MVLSDPLCLARARHSYPRFRRAPIFRKRKNYILRLTKGKKTMMIKTERAKGSRVYTDPRVNMLGERVERVWEDPLMNPRQTYR